MKHKKEKYIAKTKGGTDTKKEEKKQLRKGFQELKL